MNEQERNLLRAEAAELRRKREAAAAELKWITAEKAGLGTAESLRARLAEVDAAEAELRRREAAVTQRRSLRDTAAAHLTEYCAKRDALLQLIIDRGSKFRPSGEPHGGSDGSGGSTPPSPGAPPTEDSGDIVAGADPMLLLEADLPAETITVVKLIVAYAESFIRNAERTVAEMEAELQSAEAERDAAIRRYAAADRDARAAKEELERLEVLRQLEREEKETIEAADARLDEILQALLDPAQPAEPKEPQDDDFARSVRLRRFPRELPEYLRITVGRSQLEPAVDRVMERLRSSTAFRAEEHIPHLDRMVGRYGIGADLVEVTNRINRTKQHAVTRRILADTWAYTLLHVLRDVEHHDVGVGNPAANGANGANGGGAHPTPAQRTAMREIVRDVVGFTNRVFAFQRGSSEDNAARSPQQLFAEAFIREVGVRQRLRLPEGSAAKKDLRARVLAGL